MKLSSFFGRSALNGIASCMAAALVGWVGVANADPISFLPANSDLSIKFVDREKEITGLGQELFGLVNITQFNNFDSSITFWNGNGATDGFQLVGYFEGLTSIADQTGGTGLSFTGGHIVLYLVPNGQYSPGTSPNTKDFADQLCGGACPAPWLTADFVAGINDALGPTGDATLQAALAATNVQAGFGYLSVTGGTNAAFFDTNGFTFTNFDPADISLRSNFVLANNLPGSQCTTTTSNGWGVCSDDPLNARTAVPEPGILALLGIALFGFGFARRRVS